MPDDIGIAPSDNVQPLPPVDGIRALRWARQNLFGSWFHTVLTLASAALVATVAFGLIRWAIHEARWEVIPANLKLLLVGTYPTDQMWRVWMTLYLAVLLLGFSGARRGGSIRRISEVAAGASILLGILPLSLGVRVWILGTALSVAIGFGLGCLTLRNGGSSVKRVELAAWLLSVPASVILLNGVGGILPVVEARAQWGFLLNLLGATVGICLSLPLGVLLALGRRSQLPAVRWVCVAYIEIIRGVPLITLLFMANIMLQILLPDSIRIELVVRAMLTITAFSAAYMAENVRGGLQAIPKGQREAAHALGLNSILTTALIVLPQAIRAVIPAIVGQAIALFKDTTLFGFIGILELLSVSRSVAANLEWRGTVFELYVFIGLLFWILCYSMSYVGRRIEKALGVGQR